MSAAGEGSGPGTGSGVGALVAADVTVAYGDAVVLRDASLTLSPGSVTAIVGPNGAGKSTLLGVLAGAVQPSAGTVTMDGTPLGRLGAEARARRIGVLTQENHVSFPFRVHEVVEMGRAPWARTPQEDDDEAAIAAAAQATDVLGLWRREVPTLSGGEKARTALARVLAQRTPVVLFDEPTAALDLRHQRDIMRTMRTLADAGAAVGVVLHDLTLVGVYADAVAVMDRGEIAAQGAPAEVMTAELLRRVYEVDVEVVRRKGATYVFPVEGR